MHVVRHVALSLTLAALLARPAAADLQSDLLAAAGPLQAAVADAGPLVADGRAPEVNAKLLAVFPEPTRTPAQALVLGDMLFHQNPAASYALHRQAALGLPAEPDPQLEWALEQHRAGQWSAAAASYAKYTAAHPRFGPAWGMAAECLLRTGHDREAVAAWAKSEAGEGSLETLESWVCDVHTHDAPDLDRAALVTKVRAGDAAAAVSLVALDCDLPRDWWNAGPDVEFLDRDLAVLKATRFADPAPVIAAECAARCGRIVANGRGDAAGVLARAGFLLDPKATLPPDGRLLSTMLAAVETTHALTAERARDRFGPAVLARATATRDAATYNAAAHLYVGTPRLADIDQQAWDATGDARFAASRLVGLDAAGKLSGPDDPLLVRAAKQFPDDAVIARLVLVQAHKAGRPLRPALVAAILAEYTHFAPGRSLLGAGRPSAAALRGYFALLAQQP